MLANNKMIVEINVSTRMQIFNTNEELFNRVMEY
jgi:hypothetical protein